MKKVITVALALAVLSGCQTTRQNAMTGETEMNSTTSGSLWGCAGGAIIGAIANKGNGALVGCAAGGAVGGAVGYQVDKQEDLLREELKNSGVSVKRNGKNIELLLQGDITFNTGNANIKEGMNPAFRSIVKVMNEYKDTNLIIVGHTDATGSVDYNQKLSEVRAKSVQSKLNGYGLSRSRTFAEGYGEMNPLCENKTEQGKACNRRVELIITPKEK